MTGSSHSDAEVCIAIATYERPVGLAQLIESIFRMENPPTYSISVVNNSPSGSIDDAIFADAPPECLGVQVVRESTPGIAAARNAAVSLASGSEFICFVDDDETVESDWLFRLVQRARNDCAAGVSGPVVFDFVGEPPSWALEGNFYIIPDFTAGQSVQEAATNNLLLRTELFETYSFDSDYGLTGGSDILLTRTMSRDGVKIVWEPEARVREITTGERLSPRWLRRRAIRSGNTTARVSLSLTPKTYSSLLRVGVGGATRIAAAAVAMGVGGGLTTRTGARGYRRLLRGVGYLRALTGQNIVEYGRTSR